jgi:hypothetical protein
LDVLDVGIMIKREGDVVFVDDGHVFAEKFSDEVKTKAGAKGIPIGSEM